MVVPSNVYDSMCGTDNLQVDILQISGGGLAAQNLEADYDNTGYAKTNSTIGTCTANTDMRGTDSAALASGVNVTQLVGVTQSATDLKHFADFGYNPANSRVNSDLLAISGDNVAADNLEADYDGTGYIKTNSTIGTCTANTDMVGTNSAALAATALTDATWTDAKAGYLDHSISTVDGNVDSILTDTGTTIPDRLTGIEGATFNTATDSIEAIRNRGDAEWITAAGFNTTTPPTVVEIRTEMDSNSVDLNAILTDTNDLQTNQGDWATATGFATSGA